ncbi:MAG: 4a-hydroxytetrahydrobiopterin dehydratase [Gammaproteobacteria bacterium]|nr:4a-hydroxytetrahydrobiopterin dehydratase [Gammaproteobacteria bacterium]
MSKEHCEMCYAGMPTLSENEITQQLQTLAEWQYNKASQSIERQFQFKGFCRTMAFVNAVAWISHQEKHHPEMTVGYNYVNVTYQTHEAGGITKNDFICAQQVNELVD